MGSPSDTAELVLELATSRPPTLGTGRLVCVDGPAGSGKTTLGAALAERTGGQLIHADDLMEGWRGLDAVVASSPPWSSRCPRAGPAATEHFDWHQHRYDRVVPVPAAPWLVVEGVGSGAAAIASYITVLVWVEVDEHLRLARGLERDGEAMREPWLVFMEDERAVFEQDRTRERADVLVDGTGRRPPQVR